MDSGDDASDMFCKNKKITAQMPWASAEVSGGLPSLKEHLSQRSVENANGVSSAKQGDQ